MNHSTRNQIILYMGLFGIVILFGFFLIKEINRRQLARIVDEGRQSKMVLLNKVIEMKSKSLTSYTHDYTFWDEMVSFVKSKDYEWADRNILPSLQTFDVDYVWVLQPDLQMVYYVGRDNAPSLFSLPVDIEILNLLLNQNQFLHFFIEKNRQIIEISIAAIHPTTKAARNTDPSGYYLAGRLWSDTLIGQLGSITETTLKLLVLPNSKGIQDKTRPTHFLLKNEKALLDYNNETVAVIESVFNYEKARILSRDGNRFYVFFTFLVTLFAISFTYFFIHKVYRPLRLLSESIKNEHYLPIKELSEKNDEFGQLSKLIVEFGNQKQKLINEIAQRKEIEKQLRVVSKAIQQSPDSILITDPNGTIEFCNPSVMKISGYSRDEIVGNNPRIFSSGNKKAEEYRHLWDTISSGNIWEGEFLNRKKNGEFYWETATISPVIDSGGNITHYLAIRKDITDQKKLTQELINAKEHAEESDRLKSAFLANMSHEIRTPMNSIMGFASLLPDEESKEMMSRYANIIYQNSEQLVAIIDGIVLYSKLQTHQLSINPSVFDAGKILSEIENNFTISNLNDSIKLLIENQSKESLILKTDYEKLRQIFFNLISNATKYTHKGNITVGFNFENDEFKFYVSDTGIGIPSKDMPHIFERFYRGSNFNESTVRGTGIGLSITKELVELLGGLIWAESEEGKGSVFYFTLPPPNMIKNI